MPLQMLLMVVDVAASPVHLYGEGRERKDRSGRSLRVMEESPGGASDVRHATVLLALLASQREPHTVRRTLKRGS